MKQKRDEKEINKNQILLMDKIKDEHVIGFKNNSSNNNSNYNIMNNNSINSLNNDEFEINKEITDEDVMEQIHFEEEINFDDEYNYNLNKTLDGKIIGIAQVGTWRGTFSGYQIYSNNLNSVLRVGSSIDDFKVTYDRYNVYSRQYHHDGSHFVEFRELREDRNYDILLDKLYNQEPVSRQMINYYTKPIAHYIRDIYGA